MTHKLSYPVRYSLIITSTYIIASSLYIYVSSRVAHRVSKSLESLTEIEKLKGLGFVIFTGSVLLIFTYYCFLSLANKTGRIIKQQKALIESEKRATASIFAAVMAHDSSNVLTSMRFCLKLLERNNLIQKGEQGEELWETLKKAIHELSSLNTKMIKCSRKGISGELKQGDLVEEIKSNLGLCSVNERVNGCKINLEGLNFLPLKINSLLIDEMILNLVLNAGDATNNTGKILIKILEENDYALIEVHDNGPGVTTTENQDIFEAFYTTKSIGTGLGLLSVKACAELHNGKLEVSKSPILGGALFSIWLPLKERPLLDSAKK